MPQAQKVKSPDQAFQPQTGIPELPPQYTESLVAFYDILGFSAFVRAHPDAKDIHRLFQQIKRVASFSRESTEVFGQRFIHFSDTVIRTTPFIRADGLRNRFGILFHELLAAVHFQLDLVSREQVFLRGAITHGLIFHGETEVYGPGVIRAYELEKDVAVFPRIIIDPILLTLFERAQVLRSEDNDFAEEQEYCFSLLKCGDDGIWFVDYLSAAERELDEQEYYPVFLANHKRMILRDRDESIGLERRNHKYTWLTTYHNATVNGISKDYLDAMGADRKVLLIGSEEFPLCYLPPPQENTGGQLEEED